MNLEDLITILLLIPLLFMAPILHFLLKRKKLKAKALPRVLAISSGLYTLVGSMIFSIFLMPISEFANYTITNIFLSLAFGGIGYIGGRRIARNMPE